MQNNRKERPCNACKILEDQINLIKNQQKDKIYRFQQTINRLEEEKRKLLIQVAELRTREQQLFNDQQFIDLLNKHEGTSSETLAQLNSMKLSNDFSQKTSMLNDIQQKASALKIREIRQRQLLKRLKRKRYPFSKQHNESALQQKHDQKGNGLPYHINKLSKNVIPDPEIYFNLAKMQEKCVYFEDLSKKLEKQLNQKNKMKQEDSLRIINLLTEVQNYKKQIQNMSRLYHNQCSQLQHQKEKIVFQFSSKLKTSDDQIANTKTFIEALHHENDALRQQNEAKSSEILELKRLNSNLNTQLKKIQVHLELLMNEESYKLSQISSLSQAVSKLEQQNLSLTHNLAQETEASIQSKKQCSALRQQLSILQQSIFELQSKLTDQIKKQTQAQIDYLKNIVKQNNLILLSKEENINQIKKQIEKLRNQNAQLDSCIKDHFQVIERAESTVSYQSSVIKELQKQKMELNHLLDTSQTQRQNLSQVLQRQKDSKDQIAQNYKQEAEKHSLTYKKLGFIQRQLEEFKRLNESLQQNTIKKVETDILNEQIAKIKRQTQILSQEVTALKSKNKEQATCIATLTQELQLQTSLKSVKQKQLQIKLIQIEQVSSFNGQMLNQIESLKQQNSFLIQNLKESQNIIANLEKINAASSKKIGELNIEKIALSESIKNLQRENQQFRDYVLPQKETLINQVKLLDEQKLQLKNEYIQRFKQLNWQIHNLKTEITEKEQAMDAVRQSNRILEGHQKELHEINQKLIQQNNKLIATQKELRNQISKVKLFKQPEMVQLKQQLREKEQKLVKTKGQLSQVQANLAKLQAQYEQTIKNNEKLAQSERKASENIIYLNQKIESMAKVYQSGTGNKENEQLIKQINKKKQMITELLTNFKYLQKTLQKKQLQFDNLTAEHQKYCKNAEKDKFQLNQKIIAKQTQLQSIRRQKEQQVKKALSRLKETEKQVQHLQQSQKQKEKLHQEQKKQIEKQLIKLTEQKRKYQQSSAREIINLKESLQTQKRKSLESSLNSSPAKVDQTKRKQIENLKKTLRQNEQAISLATNRIKSMQNEIFLLQEANNKHLLQVKTSKQSAQSKDAELSKLREDVAVKEKQHASLQQIIKNIEAKYSKLNKQLTEKNLAYDFLWVQLDQQKKKVKNMQSQLYENGRANFVTTVQSEEYIIKNNQNQTPLKTFNKPSSNVLEIDQYLEEALNSNIPNSQHQTPIREIESFVQLITKEQNEQKEDAPINLPMTLSKLSIEKNLPTSQLEIQKPQKKDNSDPVVLIVQSKEEEVKDIPKKNSSKHIIFHQNLSEILSDSQQNDQINEMVSNKNSDNHSHLQSSIEAFSEYSRAKSTRSELNHKQVEEKYRNKIKNTRMLAKLGKSSKKK